MVDDDPSVLRLLAALLAARGYEVTTASDGGSALEKLEAEAPRLVILDLLLPDMDGSEVLRRIRAVSRVPVLVLTAVGEAADRSRLLGLGADEYMTKPFDIMRLLGRVRELLGEG